MSTDLDNVLPADAVPLTFDNAGAPVTAGTTAAAPAVPSGGTVILLTLGDGRKVKMERPKVSLSENIANLMKDTSYGDMLSSELERQRLKSLLYISEIDGQTEPRIFDKTMRKGLEIKLGDEYLDPIFMAWVQHFGSGGAVEVTVLKK